MSPSAIGNRASPSASPLVRPNEFVRVGIDRESRWLASEPTTSGGDRE